MASKSKYTGILAKPRKPWGPLPMLDTDEELRRRVGVDRHEFLECLSAVLDHYSIDREDPAALTRLLHALLFEHVPGFRRAKGRGRGEVWTDEKMVALVSTVRSMVDAGHTEADAIRKLVRDERFGVTSEASLRRRFDEAAKSPAVGAFESLVKLSAGNLNWSDIVEFGSAKNDD